MELAVVVAMEGRGIGLWKNHTREALPGRGSFCWVYDRHRPPSLLAKDFSSSCAVRALSSSLDREARAIVRGPTIVVQPTYRLDAQEPARSMSARAAVGRSNAGRFRAVAGQCGGRGAFRRMKAARDAPALLVHGGPTARKGSKGLTAPR